MKFAPEVESRIRSYLDQVEAHLGDRPADIRAELLRQLESHLYEALQRRGGEQPTAEEADAVLGDMDPPEVYAHEADDPVILPVPEAPPPRLPPGSGRWFAIALSFLALNGWAVWHWAHGGGRAADAEVAAFSAEEDAVTEGRTPVAWTFGADMVAADAVGAPTAGEPVAIRPRVAGEFAWTGRRELTFTPERDWPACQLYEAVVADSLRAADGRKVGGERVFHFQTHPLELKRVEQAAIGPEREVTLRLVFNAAPDPRSLEKSLKFAAPDQPKIGWQRVGQVASPTVLIKTEPVRNDKLTVTLEKGLSASAGPLGLPETAASELALQSGFVLQKLQAVSPAFEPCSLEAIFTSAVDANDAAAFLEVRPAVKFDVAPLESWRGAGCTLAGDFTPGQTYVLTFKAGLHSADGANLGKKLGKDVTRHVTFPNRAPSLAVAADGAYLSPRGALKVPVAAMNLRECQVTLRPVLARNLGFYALREAGLSGYGSGPEGAAEMLTGAAKRRTYALDGPPNRESKIPVDLRELAGEEPHGAYLLSADGRKVSAVHRLVVVTDLGLSAKCGRDGVWVWVNALRTAAPVADAEVTVYGRNNSELGHARTDAQGLVFVACPTADEDAPPFVVTAAVGRDLSFLRLHAAGDAGAGEDTGGAPYLAGGFEAYVFTDRGIYRPGETLHAKALVRDLHLDAPAAFPVVFRVLKPDGRVFQDLPAKLNERGAAEVTVRFPDYLPTGRYTIQLAMPGTFKVLGEATAGLEDFVPPQIAATLEQAPARVAAGAELAYAVSARHLFGRAASGLPAGGYVSFQPAPFAPDAWKGYRFGDDEKSFAPVYRNLDRKTLDAEGRATFSLPVPANWRPPAALKAGLSATVTETSGRSVSAYGATIVDAYPFYVGLKPAREGGHVRVGEAQRVAVAAVRPDGAAFQPESPLKVVLARVQWTSALKRNASGSYAYQSERTVQVEQEEKVTLAKGEGALSFQASRAGDYLLTVRDPFSGASSSLRFYAAAADQAWVDWARDKPDRVELSLDRKTYAPGDTAKLAIKAPFAGLALLTIESDRVLEHRVLHLEQNTGAAEIAVRAEFSPNVYCCLTMIRPATAESVWSAHRASGAVPLAVTPPGRKLEVQLEAPATIRPQTKLTAHVKVRDGAGRGAETELAVAAVDEGICLLTDFETPDPLKFFLSQRRLGVDTFDLYGELMPVLSDEGIAGAASHTGGGAASLLRRRLNPVRANRFKPVALWVSGVMTDTNGEADVEFNVPEFTGELRLMAVAFDRGRTGSGRGAVKVKRPLIVQAGLPRFLAPGDMCRMGLQVFNETGAAQDVQWRVTCGGPLAAEQSEGVLALAAGASGVAPVALRAGAAPGKALCTIEVTAGAERYAETIELAVRPAAAPAVTAEFGTVDARRAARIQPPKGWMGESLHYELWAGGRPDVKLNGSLDYLLRYPYGCCEQTTSSAFPLLYLADLAARTRPQALGGAEVATYVQAGILRLLSMQRANGAFSMWPYSNEIAPWVSIYATHFLVEARKAGYDVPADRFDAALAALKERLDAPAPTDADPKNPAWLDDMEERAYACQVLALAGQPEPGWTARLREQADRLSYSARVHVASALLASGQPREATALLEALGLPTDSEARRDGGCLNSRVRETALALSAWLDISPDHALVPQLVKRLEGLEVDGRWYTTQENAMALLALGKYARRLPPERTPFAATATFDDGAKQAFDGVAGLKWVSKEPGAVKSFTIENEGPGKCWYGVRIEGVPADGVVKEADQGGLKVRREWLDLQGRPLDVKSLRQGDLAVVRIVVETDHGVNNLAIEELLPAGWEIENPSLATAQTLPWITDKTDWCVHRDIRDDRLILFTGMVSGRAVYHYAVRAVTPGTFVLPAITAEGMYDPAVRSVNGRGTVEVKE